MKEPKIEQFKNFLKLKKRQTTDYIVVHCAATQNKPTIDRVSIDQMHRGKFLCIGYHFVITTDGRIQRGRDLDVVGAHVKGYNHNSVGICLIGGIDRKGKSVDNFTEAQKKSLRELITYLLSLYPNAQVQGHRDFPNVAKDCPCFDVKTWFGKYPKFIAYNGTIPEHEISDHDFFVVNGEGPFKDGQMLLVSK